MDKDLLASLLVVKNNDFFRGTLDKNDPYYIYDAQINTARKLVLNLGSNVLRSNHVMLLAPMQSGKTATCLSVINIINKSRLFINMAIKKYMFVSGMNDCGLKNQTFERVRKQVIGCTDEMLSDGRNNLDTAKYFVLKNSDLLPFEGTLDNTLIFIDESHYGSNEKNVLTKFLYKHGIDWKNTNELIKRNIYICSISATPFDELVSDGVDAKKLVELDTDDEYVGITDYLEKDVIFDAEKDDIEEDGRIFELITDAKWRMDDDKKSGIIIIRTRKFNIIKENPYVESNFDIFEMHSNGSSIQYDKLNEWMEAIYTSNKEKGKKTTRPLIVLIKGAFRAGITIPSKYKDIIYMVYDYSEKADTTAQALLGRMCGYRDKGSHFENTQFYVNKKFANMYSAWENDFQNKSLIPCNKSTYEWVDNDYSGSDVMFGSKPCGNFTIDMNDSDIKEWFLSCKGKRKRAEIIENRFDQLLKKNGYEIKYDYINEVQVSGKNNYSKSSQEKRFNSFSDDLLVFQFRPDKIKKFMEDTNRDYLTREDVGKRCVSIVLDAIINEKDGEVIVSGNKRLLVYYVEVGQKKMTFCRKGQYKAHKDTDLGD